MAEPVSRQGPSFQDSQATARSALAGASGKGGCGLFVCLFNESGFFGASLIIWAQGTIIHLLSFIHHLQGILLIFRGAGTGPERRAELGVV